MTTKTHANCFSNFFPTPTCSMATGTIANDTPPLLLDYSRKVHEDALAKLTTAITVARLKEPPDQQPIVTPQRGWSLPPSVTDAPLGIKPWAVPRLRVEPPRFDGENVLDWICKIQEYYNHHYTPLDDRLYLTQYLFDHPASDWREYWEENNKEKGWDAFLLAVKQRFDPDLYDDDVSRLATLRQTSTVEAYQTSFESLLQKASHIGDSMLSYLFIAGLKSPLKQVVLMRRPSTLKETFTITRQLQAYYAATTSPGPFMRTEGTIRDQEQLNCAPPYLVANWKQPIHPTPQQREEVTYVIVDNQFDARPLNAESSNIFSNVSSSNSTVCDEDMNQNMGSANYGVSNELGFDPMDAIRDVDQFLGFGNPKSCSGWSVDAELPFPHCNRDDGKFPVEARHISGEVIGVPVVYDDNHMKTIFYEQSVAMDSLAIDDTAQSNLDDATKICLMEEMVFPMKGDGHNMIPDSPFVEHIASVVDGYLVHNKATHSDDHGCRRVSRQRTPYFAGEKLSASEIPVNPIRHTPLNASSTRTWRPPPSRTEAAVHIAELNFSSTFNWSNLVHLDVSENAFSGRFSIGLSCDVNLRHLDLAHNCFKEQEPLHADMLSGFEYLNLSATNVIGEIPCNASHLSSLRIPDFFVGLLFLASGCRSKASMWAMEQSSCKEELTISRTFSFHTDSTTWVVDVKQAKMVLVVCDNEWLKICYSGDFLKWPKFLDNELYESIREVSYLGDGEWSFATPRFGEDNGVRIFDPGDFESASTLDETRMFLFHCPP